MSCLTIIPSEGAHDNCSTPLDAKRDRMSLSLSFNYTTGGTTMGTVAVLSLYMIAKRHNCFSVDV